ncbi:MAG: cell wall metabolism sensor histidine kinase WalK [Chloroflexi bacterium]|nr:cell wall metabolism sensor histidine kinase WalK [Chloroflexota bacterium]
MLRSIRWRVALLHSAVALGALILLTVYLLNYLYGAYADSRRDQSFRQAWLVASIAEQRLQAQPDGRNMDAMAKELRPRLGERVTIIGADGTVWGDSDEDPSRMERHSDRIEVRAALQSGGGSSVRESTTLGYAMLYVAVPITSGGRVVGVARLATPLDDLGAAMGHIQRTVALAGALVAGLMVLLGVYLARSITTPISDLTETAKRIASGDLDQYVPVSTQDEIGSLARAFNQMTGHLRETIRAITMERNQTAAVLTHMVDGVVVVEPDGTVGLLNPAVWDLLGREPAEAKGHSFASVVRDHQLVELYQASLSAGGQDQERYCELGGSRRFVRAVATAIPGERGQRMLVLLEDLSELRRLEMVRRDFAANASHELRTPLASLRAVVETLEAGIDDEAVVRDFLGRMHAELDRLTQMTTELIEISRIESGQTALHRRPTDIGQVARRAAEMLRPQAERAGLTITVEAPEGLPRVEIDPDRIQTTLVNIIHNAVKFTPAGGSINVAAFARGNEVGVSVADTGVGIAAEELPRIFERFYKADPSRAGGGTGLGLAIAKHIIQAHGGRIWAESAEGRGATFTFTVPVSPALASKAFTQS